MDSRVLHLDCGAEWRGGQRQLYLLALEQRGMGMEPLVVGQPRSRLVTRLRAAGLGSAGVRMRGRWDLNAVRRIRRLIRMWHPQIVHAHDVRAMALARTALAGIDGVALVVTCRTIPERTAGLKKMRAGDAFFIAPNARVGAFLKELGVSPARVALVRPGVPSHGDVTPRNWRHECAWPGESVVCGVIGVSSRQQREEFENIVARIPEASRVKARFVLLGGPPAGGTRISGTAAYQAGFVDEIAAAIAGFDLLLNLSGTESMSTAVLDAMSLGVVPIAYSSGGAEEYTEHGRSDLVIEHHDHVAFATAVSSLIADPALRSRLADSGRAHVAQFSAERMADATRLVYEEVLRMRAGSSAGFLTA